MIRSRAVAHQKPCSFSSISLIFVMRMVWKPFTVLVHKKEKGTFGTILFRCNEKKAATLASCSSSTSSLTICDTSLCSMALCIYDTGNALPWYSPSFDVKNVAIVV